METSQTDALLEVRNLNMHFPVTKGFPRREVSNLKAVNNISFKMKRGETMGIVGESGCGKTTLARCVLRIYHPTSGDIILDGENIADIPSRKIRDLRRRVQLIFQDPFASLNPRQSAGSIVGEALKIHRICNSREERETRVSELFSMVGLDPEMTNRYPHEFSGGQRQRIGIARALSCDPGFIVCDEPISALDVSIQAQIINLLQELQRKLGLTYLIISHDLSVVRHICDTVAVMYAGHIVEMAGWEDIFTNPLMPYTQALISAVPMPSPTIERQREHITLKGEVPSLIDPPSGCPFHPRCWQKTDECAETKPRLRDVGKGHQVACIKVPGYNQTN